MFGTNSYANEQSTFSTKSPKLIQNVAETHIPVEDKIENIHADGGIEKVTLEEAENWADRKGNDVIHLLQKVVQPFAVIVFMLSAFISLVGSFGNSQLIGRGLLGMGIAVTMYAVVLYAPEILNYLTGWLTS